MGDELPRRIVKADLIDDPAEDFALAQRLTREALTGEGLDVPKEIEYLDDLTRRDYQQDLELKGRVAKIATWAVVGQLVAADVAFGVYLGLNHGHVPGQVVDVWLSATVLQVIGILVIIAQYLFPREGRKRPAFPARRGGDES